MNESEPFFPIINPDRCNGCGECVDVCPSAALELISRVALLTGPGRCVYCADCEEHCPQGAISLSYEIVVDPVASTSPLR